MAIEDEFLTAAEFAESSESEVDTNEAENIKKPVTVMKSTDTETSNPTEDTKQVVSKQQKARRPTLSLDFAQAAMVLDHLSVPYADTLVLFLYSLIGEAYMNNPETKNPADVIDWSSEIKSRLNGQTVRFAEIAPEALIKKLMSDIDKNEHKKANPVYHILLAIATAHRVSRPKAKTDTAKEANGNGNGKDKEKEAKTNDLVSLSNHLVSLLSRIRSLYDEGASNADNKKKNYLSAVDAYCAEFGIAASVCAKLFTCLNQSIAKTSNSTWKTFGEAHRDFVKRSNLDSVELARYLPAAIPLHLAISKSHPHYRIFEASRIRYSLLGFSNQLSWFVILRLMSLHTNPLLDASSLKDCPLFDIGARLKILDYSENQDRRGHVLNRVIALRDRHNRYLRSVSKASSSSSSSSELDGFYRDAADSYEFVGTYRLATNARQMTQASKPDIDVGLTPCLITHPAIPSGLFEVKYNSGSQSKRKADDDSDTNGSTNDADTATGTTGTTGTAGKRPKKIQATAPAKKPVSSPVSKQQAQSTHMPEVPMIMATSIGTSLYNGLNPVIYRIVDSEHDSGDTGLTAGLVFFVSDFSDSGTRAVLGPQYVRACGSNLDKAFIVRTASDAWSIASTSSVELETNLTLSINDESTFKKLYGVRSTSAFITIDIPRSLFHSPLFQTGPASPLISEQFIAGGGNARPIPFYISGDSVKQLMTSEASGHCLLPHPYAPNRAIRLNVSQMVYSYLRAYVCMTDSDETADAGEA